MDVIVQPLSQRETQLNKLEQGKDVGVEFSALDIITFSQQVTAECIEVIKAPQTSWLLKLWSLARIINNFMNREAFFLYRSDLLCLFLHLQRLGNKNNEIFRVLHGWSSHS
jgi:hypothetical protein